MQLQLPAHILIVSAGHGAVVELHHVLRQRPRLVREQVLHLGRDEKCQTWYGARDNLYGTRFTYFYPGGTVVGLVLKGG